LEGGVLLLLLLQLDLLLVLLMREVDQHVVIEGLLRLQHLHLGLILLGGRLRGISNALRRKLLVYAAWLELSASLGSLPIERVALDSSSSTRISSCRISFVLESFGSPAYRLHFSIRVLAARTTRTQMLHLYAISPRKSLLLQLGCKRRTIHLLVLLECLM